MMKGVLQMTANLTVIGMYYYDNNLFEGLDILGIEKDLLINTILLRCGEFEVLYSNLPFFKNAITLWNDKHRRTFEKWINAINLQYNPIHNYDRTEEWEDSANSSADNENLVSAFNSPAYQNNAKNINDIKINSSRKGKISGNIGVTTTQEMLKSEFDVARWNVYEQIADLFVTEFCLMVY